MRSKHYLLALCAAGSIVQTPASGAPVKPLEQGPQAAAHTLVGNWEGMLQQGQSPLYVYMQFSNEQGQLTGHAVLLGAKTDLGPLELKSGGFSKIIGEGARRLLVQADLRNGKIVGIWRRGDNEALAFELDPIPKYVKPADRVAAWDQDLDALEHRFLKYDLSFTPAEQMLFKEAIESLRKELQQLSDQQIQARIAAAIALSDNAHTRLYVLRVHNRVPRLPIRLWWFDEGLYVVGTTPEQRGLLGCRIRTIGGLHVRQARDLVGPAFAGNGSWRDYMSIYTLTSPDLLNGFGVTPDPESVKFGLSDCASEKTTVTLTRPALEVDTKTEEDWWYLSPNHASKKGEWLNIHDKAVDRLPLFLTRPDENFWYEYLPASGVLYVQFNRSANMGDRTVAQFGEELLAEFDKRPINALVFDVRFNTGGDLTLARDLIPKLEARSREIPRFFITGRATFSAGIAPLAQWSQAGPVTIVGEPVGDRLDFYAEGGNIFLPNSGIAAHFANGLNSYSSAPCPKDLPCAADFSSGSLRPHIHTYQSWDDYTRRRDPALEAILNELRPRPAK